MNSSTPPAMDSDGCDKPRNSRITVPANRNVSRITSAITSSRAVICARRCGVKRDSTALKTGMLPSGSMTKNSVAAAAAISDQFMRAPRYRPAQTRTTPSCAVDATSTPSRVKNLPSASPRPPDAFGLSIA